MLLFRKLHYIFLIIYHLLSKKAIHLVLSRSLLYALISGRNMRKGPIYLVSLWPMKYLKLFLSKKFLLDTTILLTSILSTEIGFLYWWNFCFLNSISTHFMFVLSVFIYGFLNFLIYNFSLFSLKSTFWSKLIYFLSLSYILSKELFKSLLFIMKLFFSF